jgi:hypothetical protein
MKKEVFTKRIFLFLLRRILPFYIGNNCNHPFWATRKLNYQQENGIMNNRLKRKTGGRARLLSVMLLVALVLALFMAFTVYAASLVINGSFDTDLSGWSTSGNVAFYNGSALFSGDDYTSANGQIWQDLNTVSGQTYTVDYDVSRVGNGTLGPAKVGAMVVDLEHDDSFPYYFEVCTAGAGVVTHCTATFVAQGSISQIVFSDETGTDTFHMDPVLDNVSVTAPNTAARSR